jgi:2-aminoethylphosphonate-pyruvate transaminase
LDELLEEGLTHRFQRYRRSASRIRERMAGMGVQPYLPADLQSNTITAFHLPAGLTYTTLHDQLKARGYVIYAGQGQLESKIFRIANMGALADAQIDGFLGAFEEVLAGAAARA